MDRVQPWSRVISGRAVRWALTAAGGVSVDLGVGTGRTLSGPPRWPSLGSLSPDCLSLSRERLDDAGSHSASGTGLAVLADVLYTFAPLAPPLEVWRPLSAFAHAIRCQPLSNGLDASSSAVLVAIALTGLGLGLITFENRDIGVAVRTGPQSRKKPARDNLAR